METMVKRESRSINNNRTTRREEEEEEANPGTRRRSTRGDKGRPDHDGGVGRQDVVARRVLRYKYLAVKNMINDERDNISAESDKFKSVIDQVESLHSQVQNPREQVADAEALLDIANTIVASVKSQNSDGITPSDFITSLLSKFAHQNGELSTENPRDSMAWGNFGFAVCHIIRRAGGCSTMLGPMDMEIKQRKVVQRKRARPPAESSCHPEELDNDAEEKTDTDKNMSTMFNILRKKRSVRLEHLLLNRLSFAQTVENLFALSFLVKDGRVEITVKDNGHHLVSPKNAPAAAAVASGEVSYSHFTFRLDFKDWKLMMDSVRNGEELMPHRAQAEITNDFQREPIPDSQTAAPTTPIRKLCRNRGLVVQEDWKRGSIYSTHFTLIREINTFEFFSIDTSKKQMCRKEVEDSHMKKEVVAELSS
ncbi:hypothetical protein IFM89_039530 [Coptis chinensis]|uniref:Non-structural maintenance of chromosomes element 4 n=1 Tax=Coptis chinensis TaxID=261450 RepID=A0A835GTX7_9MAGN|nr:hypothetical protein IFM89_039530 [Coptis chinensis]